MIQIEPQHLHIVLEILRKYPYRFYAYGSRVKNKAQALSDLDVCSKENIPLNVLSHIHEDFENSNLPFRVEVVLWSKLSPEFQQLIKNDLVLIEAESESIRTLSKGL